VSVGLRESLVVVVVQQTFMKKELENDDEQANELTQSIIAAGEGVRIAFEELRQNIFDGLGEMDKGISLMRETAQNSIAANVWIEQVIDSLESIHVQITLQSTITRTFYSYHTLKCDHVSIQVSLYAQILIES
jgi:hypothetical protein